MKLKLISKTGAALVAAFALTAVANAAPITGGISFFGNYTPQNSASIAVTDLALATQIAFLPTLVGPGSTSGSFTVISGLTPVTMFTPLVFSPVTPPATDLWSVTTAPHTFSFDLNSFTVGPVIGTAPNAQSVTLQGTGSLSYAGPSSYTTTLGTWTGQFSGGAGTFTWSSSSAANVPDGGASFALLGFGLLGLGGVSRFVRRK